MYSVVNLADPVLRGETETNRHRDRDREREIDRWIEGTNEHKLAFAWEASSLERRKGTTMECIVTVQWCGRLIP